MRHILTREICCALQLRIKRVQKGFTNCMREHYFKLYRKRLATNPMRGMASVFWKNHDYDPTGLSELGWAIWGAIQELKTLPE